jgi:DNA-binding transcriptional ArsR family regulator
VAVGAQAAFTDLHPTVSWEDGALHVHPTKKAPADVDLAGRGLLLVPAVFTWPNVWPRTDPPWDPALVYPPPGIADLWAPDGRREDALESLLGRRRAQVLRQLDRPASTLELARRMGVSAASVSEHLTILRHAGLVTRRREGRRVIYARTATGDDLRAPH